MNVLQLVIRYGSVIAKYGAYLKYLPFVYQLVIFIREAEGRFREAGSGTERLHWVEGELTRVINSAEAVGMVSARMAGILRENLEGFIRAAVELMKETGGIAPIEPPAEDAAGEMSAGGTIHPVP
jgi:hypothetical protein